MKRIILRNFQPPGDTLMLTAAVRDLHLAYPGQFVTDVRTLSPALWENNPYLTPLNEDDPSTDVIDCTYPLVHRSNYAPYHFIHGFIENLNDTLGLAIKPTLFHGDVHLSDAEKSSASPIEDIVKHPVPYWIVVAGGKRDFTVKRWDHQRFQRVVDHFSGTIQFVQVGAAEDDHWPLHGAIDLRGKTDLRQLIRLMYHAQGVLCTITLLMHLAAAVEVPAGMPKNRPCVVVAGGREPPHWAAYPHHQFLHRVGTLLCCDNGGCWKARVLPLRDGEEHDHPDNLCVDPVGALPRCMHLIVPHDVIRAIDVYFDGGAIQPLTRGEMAALRRSARVGAYDLAVP